MSAEQRREINDLDVTLAERWRSLAVALDREARTGYGVNEFARRDLLSAVRSLAAAALTQDHGEGIRRRDAMSAAAKGT